MIAGLLPGIASDVSISVSQAGQLVTAFALAYALGTPLLAISIAKVERRTLLVISLSLFATLNALATVATSYLALMALRIGMALAAGLFMPTAVALAGTIAGPERRGRAVALVSGGVTLAIAFGSPLGTLIGDAYGWRAPFALVAILAIVAAGGVRFGIDSTHGLALAVPPLRERLKVFSVPSIRRLYFVCALYALSGLMVYTYLAPITSAVTGEMGQLVGGMQALWGVGAAIGIFAGGTLVDRYGAARVGFWSLALQLPGFCVIAVLAHLGPRSDLIIPLAATILIWGLPSWSYWPAHQASLMASAPDLAAISLSLNQAVMYAGISGGALLGGTILSALPGLGPSFLAWVAAAIDLVAVTVFALASHPRGGAASVKSATDKT